MLYFAVARDDHDGGVQVTASHNPEAVQRHEDGASRGVPAERRRRHLRYPRHDCRRHDRPRQRHGRGEVSHKDVLDAYVATRHGASSIRRSIKPFNVVLDAGSGMGGLVAPKLFDRLPCRTTRLCFEIDGRFPEPRSEPADRRKPARHRRARRRRQGRHRHCVGRRRRPLLLHRRHRRVHLRRLHHGAPRGSVSPEASRLDGHLRPSREPCGEGHGRALPRHCR